MQLFFRDLILTSATNRQQAKFAFTRACRHDRSDLPFSLCRARCRRISSMQPLLISVETGLFRPTNPLSASFVLRQTVIHDKHATIKPFGFPTLPFRVCLIPKILTPSLDKPRLLPSPLFLSSSSSPLLRPYSSHTSSPRRPLFYLSGATITQCRADKYSRRQTTRKSVGIQNGEHEVSFPSGKEPSNRRFSPIQSAHQFPSRAAARQPPARYCRR